MAASSGSGHAIDPVDLQAENVPSAGVPRDRPALADIPEEMMLRAGGDLLDLQIKWDRLRLDDGRSRHQHKCERQELGAERLAVHSWESMRGPVALFRSE